MATNPNVKSAPLPAAKPAPAPAAASAVRATPHAEASKLEQLTREIAYGLYEKRGRQPGRDVEDWVEAEKLAKKQLGIA